ncbi:MAG TPA: pitrilysin family protein [Terriglobales bacterium]|nr:pitrilysin family protein [Terriglobales bacterium]
MKKAILFAILFGLATTPVALPQTAAAPAKGNSAQHQKPAAASGIPNSWKQVPIPPLHAFKPQEPKRIELPNGMVIFLQEDHELPLIDGVIRIRGGSRDEPAERVGLTSIYGEVWRTGGTVSKTGDQLDDFLESRAARVETSGGIDSTFLSWSSLKDDFDEVFPVILDLLEHPAFRQDKIMLAQRQIASAISRRNDDIDDIAGREAAKLAYGPENPYARTAEYYTISAVTRDDLVSWHKQTVVPNNMMLGITGDFDSAAMERRLREAFAGMPKGKPYASSTIAFREPKPGMYFIEKSDVNQSEISMVDLGIERKNPDYYAVVAMNEILGGGFASRLFSNLRTKQGLAYSVGGGVGSAFDHPGVTNFGMGTKSGSTARGVEALKDQIAELIKGGVTQTELTRAKDSILNSFIFEFDSKDKVLAERMRYEFYGYPPNFLELFRAGIEKVTTTDVDRVARKYLHPEKLAVLVVGNSKDFDRDLASFGKVTSIDITIPQQKKPGM